MLPNIFHFTPLHGLTRLQTIERETVLFALVKTRRSRNSKRSDGVNVTAAAHWLGIARTTLYGMLSSYVKAGCPIQCEWEPKAPRRQAYCPKVIILLKRLGVVIPPGRFWNQSREALQDIFDEANRIRLAKVRELRPDLNPTTEGMAAIHHWLSIRRIFERRGFSLSRLRS